MMGDLKNPRLIWLKGLLFLVGGLLSGFLLMVEDFSFQNLALLVIAIWCFCRAYYFVFYVIEHYLDSSYRFSGLGSFVRWRLTGRSRQKK